jgi:hypothetical protein
MHRVLLVALILAYGVTSADARSRRHRHKLPQPYVYVVPPDAPAMARSGRHDLPRMQSGTAPLREEPPRRGYYSPAGLVPPDWKAEAADPIWKGQRFLSPDGAASFAMYTTPTAQQPIAAHMKSIAFADGEEITYLSGERTWIAVGGFKGDRIFYRQAVLACAGDRWHHIAFEYPATAKRSMEEFVKRAAEVVRASDNYGCDTPVSSR